MVPNYYVLFWLFVLAVDTLTEAQDFNYNVDENGYIVYCPCMGRFGNQADHFLGALGFAKGLGRTLVLPPWVEYRYGESKSIQVPFDTYFQVEPFQEFHKVITMENFMKYIAPMIWPPGKRIAFCYVARGTNEDCNAKEGNPFGPFWDTFNIDFIKSEFYSPLHYDVHHSKMAEMWNAKYSPSEWPVLAFAGAPASFPVQLENRELHRYLKWNVTIDKAANDFIKTKLPKGGFIGIHLRNGIDWVRACEHIKVSPHLFASPQCLGYRNEYGHATQEMCFPMIELIVKQLKRLIRNAKDIASIFVASDSNHMINDLSIALKKLENSVLSCQRVVWQTSSCIKLLFVEQSVPIMNSPKMTEDPALRPSKIFQTVRGQTGKPQVISMAASTKQLVQ